MRLAILVMLAASCRFDSGGVSDGGIAVTDASPTDAPAEARPDAGMCGADAGVCCGEIDGKRVCEDPSTASASCVGGEVTRDRECPPGSACEGFVCTLATACEVCTGNSCGVGRMCSVFATVGSINTCCTPCFDAPRGCAAPGTPCGSSDDCASGVCVSDGGPGQCYFNCQNADDCGDGGVCEVQTIRVDGLTNGAPGCRAP